MRHDQSLHKLLARVEEKNLTLNGEKCSFGMEKVVSWAFSFGSLFLFVVEYSIYLSFNIRGLFLS